MDSPSKRPFESVFSLSSPSILLLLLLFHDELITCHEYTNSNITVVIKPIQFIRIMRFLDFLRKDKNGDQWKVIQIY